MNRTRRLPSRTFLPRAANQPLSFLSRALRLAGAAALTGTVALGATTALPASAGESALTTGAASPTAGPFVPQSQFDLGPASQKLQLMGNSVALSGDGHVAFVGVPYRAVNGIYGAGAVEVYRYDGKVWNGPVQLDISKSITSYAYFGQSVHASNDGNTVLINHYVYTYKDGNWSTPVNLNTSASYYALSGNGRTILAEDQVFRFTKGKWIGSTLRTTRQVLSDSLSYDGNTALLGEPHSSISTYPGQAQVFRFKNGKWQKPTTLKPGPNAGVPEVFGLSTALSGDGKTALLNSAKGKTTYAEIFSYRGGKWRRVELTVDSGILNAKNQGSVALSRDGKTALIGEPRRIINGHAEGGGVQVLRANPGWSRIQGLNLNSTGKDQFGNSLALSDHGTIALAGLQLHTVNGKYGAGAVEVLTTDPTGAVVTLQATGKRGATPNLIGLAPTDPRISYVPTAARAAMTGTLSCATTATKKSKPGYYNVMSCGGLSDPGHTVVYDYVNAYYRVR